MYFCCLIPPSLGIKYEFQYIINWPILLHCSLRAHIVAIKETDVLYMTET